MKTGHLLISFALGLGLALALLCILGDLTPPVTATPRPALAQASRAPTDELRVCLAGPPTCDHDSIQKAVKAANSGDVIKVAAGVYTDVQGRPVPVGYPSPPADGLVTQIVYISKSVTIRGGYITAFTEPPNPEANPTTLDAQGQGRVLYIAGNISSTIEGLRITGGDATGLGGRSWGDAGGGVYVVAATAILSNNYLFSNTAYYGGGLYLLDSDATLNANTVSSNTANWYGGGLYLSSSDAVLDNNFVTDNALSSGNGSGLYISNSRPQLRHNTIARNHGGGGEGLYVTGGKFSQPQLYNTILVSHSVGIYIAGDSSAQLEGTLWGSGIWANGADWSGNVATGAVNVWGDPDFVDYATLDYHINAGSAAVDAGTYPRLNDDMDGDPRPMAFGPDIGADERPGPGLQLHKWASLPLSQDVRNPGQIVTYTLAVTGVGAGPVSDVILTDTLPPEQRVIASAASTGTCATATATVWGGQVTCTLGKLDVGHSARVTLTAQVTTTIPSPLPWRMRNRAWVTGDQASDYVYTDVYLQDCHARLNDDPREWDDIQTAVDASTQPTDVVKVAGVCAGINSRGGARQVLYISQTVNIRGGYSYSPTNWTTPDQGANPTTLDAMGRGRVLYVTGDINPTIEGLRITDGYVKASGGGIYNKGANLTLINTIVTNNISNGINWPDGLGGGMYIETGNVVLSEVQIISNSASYKGGGVLVWSGSVMLSGGQISHNTAKGPTGWDGGGGMFVLGSATLNGVQVISNTAIANGGGLYVYQSNVTVNGGQIIDNSAWGGGGVFIFWSGGGLTLSEGQIISNTADYGGGVYTTAGTVFTMTGASSIDHNSAIENGGGVYVEDGLATLSGGQIRNNSASRGGGVYVSQGRLTLSRGHIVSNTASQDGGGIFVWQSTANTALTNSVVADNRAAGLGSGLYIEGGSFRLLHTTIARNLGGDGSGVHAAGSATMVMTNTILVSHSVGITVAAGNTATLQRTLWGTDTWANLVDWGGDGAVIANANLWDYPAFVAPDAGDYHIGPGSAAIDAGVNAGVTSDIDGEPRPMGHDYDIGADELRIALAVSKQAAPDPVQAGAQLTYTLRVTNTGDLTLTATITDVLPNHVTTMQPLVWASQVIPAPGGIWTKTVVVTVELTCVETLTNRVQVTTTAGVTGLASVSVSVPPLAPALSSPANGALISDATPTLTWQASPCPHAAGYLLDFNGLISDMGNITQTTTTALADGVYTWTVAAYDQVGSTSDYTDTWSFTIDTTPPITPALVSPANGTLTSTNELTLTWTTSPSLDVAGYLLDFNGLISDMGDITQTVTPTLPDGIYTWTVAAYDALRNTSPYANAWSFEMDTTPPTIIATVPISGATDVHITAPVVITFSEEINTGTFSHTTKPDPGGWAAIWDSAGTVVTLTHDPFAYLTTYTVTVTAANDLAGNSLSDAPYTWHFTTVPYRVYLPIMLKNHGQ